MALVCITVRYDSGGQMKNNPLVGTYELISWENHHGAGQVTFPLGPDARGIISYAPDGFVFVHLMANNRPNHSVESGSVSSRESDGAGELRRARLRW